MSETYDYSGTGHDLTAISSTVIRRVRNKLRRNRLFMLSLALVAAVWVMVALVMNVVIGDLTWPMAIGVAAVFGWLAMYSKAIMPLRVTVTCPNCDELINLNKDWICGSCDAEKSPLAMQTYVRHRIPLERCEECDEAANAIECPHCSYVAPTEFLTNDGQLRVAKFL